jgi:hypothetical protein
MKRVKYSTLRSFVSTPFILAMIVPLVLFDICIEVYHRICFPLYGIAYVNRSQYIRILDREKLPYLNILEKLWCMYCGYVNGWLHYASVIAGKTENYFCAIAHIQNRGYIPTEHEKSFAKYGDEAALRRRYAAQDSLPK